MTTAVVATAYYPEKPLILSGNVGLLLPRLARAA
jgi:hypothetical protein